MFLSEFRRRTQLLRSTGGSVDSRAVFLRAKFFLETRPGTVQVLCEHFRGSTNQHAIPNRRTSAKEKEIFLMLCTTIWRTTDRMAHPSRLKSALQRLLERVPHADQRSRLGAQSAVIQSNQNIAGEYQLRDFGEWPNLHSYGRVRNVVGLVRDTCETRQS